jgi:hypothetical protein
MEENRSKRRGVQVPLPNGPLELVSIEEVEIKR